MKELAERGLNTAEVRGAEYADVRVLRRESQNITVKNGVVEALSLDSDRGLGIRVLANGAWGFAASGELSSDAVEGTAARAVQIAKASAL
ncbi:MAG: PmbA/TldA family metallopeptidase, partial [Anaerolineae bacterium]